MAKKTININSSATQMVDDINSNFNELYQGAGGSSSIDGLTTKRVKVYDVMTGAGTAGSYGQRYYKCSVKHGTKYVIEKSDRGTNWLNTEVWTADASQQRAQTLLSNSVGAFDTEVEATSDASYIAISGYSAGLINIYHYEDVPLAGTTRWLGKKWLVIGDSISVEGTEGSLPEEGYALPVARSLGIQRENFAKGGTTTSYPIDNDLISGYDDNYDLITVMYGTNDQGYSCPIGSLNDSVYTGYDGTGSVGTSYIARLQILYEKLREKYPKSVIAFITPIKRNPGSGNDYLTNALGLTTEAYAEAVKTVCDYYSIPCIDIFNAIDPRTEMSRTNFFLSSSDGTHPNTLGHALFIAPVVEARLREIAPFYFNDWNS